MVIRCLGIPMGTIERKIRITRLKENILRAIAGIGTISMAIVAPNALQALKIFGVGKKATAQKNFSYWRSIGRLESDGLVVVERKAGRYSVHLTREREKILSSFSVSRIKKKWDGRWRIIIFDIAESKRAFRDRVRARLIQFGFLRLQDSVWVFPYDCEDVIAMLKTELKIGQELLYIVALAVENDVFIKRHFDLKD